MVARVNVSAAAGWELLTDTLARNKVSVSPAPLEKEVTPHTQCLEHVVFSLQEFRLQPQQTQFELTFCPSANLKSSLSANIDII